MTLKVNIFKKLRDFDLEVQFETNQETLGILGASGDGKSMTLKCIAGIETPDRGRIELNGRVLFDSEKKINLKPQARRVGYLFQNYALFPHMTVEKNIRAAMGEEVQTAAEEMEKVQKLLTMFRLEGFEKRYPLQLSGGQQQRVALARIFAYQPEILLLDEPFAALDTYLKEQLEVEMKKVLQLYDGDVVIVTHSRDEAYRLCPNLMILEKGHVLEKGATKSIFKEPHYLTAARLSGCKNFSRIKKVHDYQIEALDWGNIKLTTAQKVTDEMRYVGIRAHYFKMAETLTEENAFPIVIEEAIEDPFEWNCVVKVPESSGEIWWKYSKERVPEKTPKFLKIAPTDLLLLAESREELGK